MATTPTDRRTVLARRLRVDIDTATAPASQYQQLLGLYELNPVIEPRVQDDETYDDAGWMREASTGANWRLEIKFKHSTDADGVTINDVQAFLRAAFFGVAESSTFDNEFGVRWYDRSGRDTGQEFEGRCYVKSWSRESNTSGDLENISVVLQGQGPLAEITNPEADLTPTVTGLDPATGLEAGGEMVNIFGQHYRPGGSDDVTDVDFGANPATGFEVVSDSHIVAVAPAGTGTVQVAVTTSNGASADTAADDYIYT